MLPAPAALLASVDLFSAIRENDWFGLSCLALLFSLSIASLTVIFYKYRSLAVAARQDRAFRRVVDQEGSWESLFVACRRYPSSPLARLLRETYVECRLEKWFEQNRSLSMEGRLDLAHRTVEAVLTRSVSVEETRLQRQLSFLSTVSTLAPFIGLLGTVWGILAAFQMIGQEGSAALSNLAPGISTALMTTIFGLFAAIPALIAFNYFAARIRELTGSMETFSSDLDNAVRKQIVKERGAPK